MLTRPLERFWLVELPKGAAMALTTSVGRYEPASGRLSLARQSASLVAALFRIFSCTSRMP